MLRKRLRAVPRAVSIEALAWLGGLVFLYVVDPSGPGRPDLCLIHRIGRIGGIGRSVGLTFCPGCGLGAAIHHAMHGDLAMSWQAHPLGVPALILLARRAGQCLMRGRILPHPHRPGSRESRGLQAAAAIERK